ERRLEPRRAAAIAVQLLAALDAAHRAGIVHRDVKPDNEFLVSAPGVEDLVKLLHFGIAKLTTAATALTGAGSVLGTPQFMAPEQVAAGPIDHRADLYAVGATLYRALAGRGPIEADSAAAMLYGIVHARPAPLLAAAP